MRTAYRAALVALSVAGGGLALWGEGGAVFGDFSSLPGVIAQASIQNAASHRMVTRPDLRDKHAKLVGRPTTPL